MSLRYLLDTNVLSEPLRVSPNSNVMAQLQQHQQEMAIASIVWHELWFGCCRLPESKKRQAIEQYLQQVIHRNIPILPYSADAAQWQATERARLASIGLTPAFADGQIAAIAKTNNLILVTGNVTDYQNFSQLEIENWYDSSNG
ncbi:type II toxin-antitoxin system VapC family toxin [Kamptonema cortianum]|nr:type II toxin-antitoxin system VapC family toxin [Geitlerinema splendidum]MDK3157815.1 type II toxin-antitoxin system VapC family toxin [Kamptonema cortianum]